MQTGAIDEPPKEFMKIWTLIKGELEKALKEGDKFASEKEFMSLHYRDIFRAVNAGKRIPTRNFISEELSGMFNRHFQGIQVEGEGAVFTENTLRLIKHVLIVADLARMLINPFNFADLVNDTILQCQLFDGNRSRVVEKCFAILAAARSGQDVSMVDTALKILRLMMIPTKVRLRDGSFQRDDEKNFVMTTPAPDIKAEFKRSMEEFLNTEHAERLANPKGECASEYCHWKDLMCTRETCWAQLVFDKNDAESVLNPIFNVDFDVGQLCAILNGLEEQCAAYPSEAAKFQLNDFYRSVRKSDEHAIKSTPVLENKFAKLFVKRLENIINTYTTSTLSNSPSHVNLSNDVGLAFAHFNSIVKECFEQYGGFTTKLRREGKLVLRKLEKQINLEHCLALDLDRTITGKNPEKSEEEIILRLSRISAVVALLLTAQDSFDRAHIMNLDDRLLSNRNDDKQRMYDKKFLEMLRKDDANFNTHPVNRRINEIEKSEEIVKKLGKLHDIVERPLLVASTAFGTVHQSKYGGTFITPVGEIKTILDDLRSTYLKYDPNSTMCWLNFKGVASLKAVIETAEGNPKIITYNMTIAQAALLLHIQERTFAGNPATWADVALHCWEKDGARSLKENLGDLMNTKKGGKPSVPLIKPSNAKFDHTTTLTLNSKFPIDKNTIDFAFKTKSNEDEDLIAARVDKIKVCMLRYMKANQHADYTTLSNHVISEAPKLRMPKPTTYQIKKVLDLLMHGTEQYIRRDEDDNRKFVYIA